MSYLKILKLPEAQKLKLYQGLEKIYESLEADLDQISRPCEACGACCQFSQAEHRLYGSGLELAYLHEHHKVIEKPREDRCPHQKNGKCSVRDHRLIGCRTYYRLHADEDRVKAEKAYERALEQVKQLTQANGLDWEYRDLMSTY